VDAFRHKNAFARLTNLPGIAKAAHCGAGDCRVQIGVVEDDRWAVAAEFQHHRLSTGMLSYQVACHRAAGESHGLGAWVGDDLLARLRTSVE
jgi:hypothetical protein